MNETKYENVKPREGGPYSLYCYSCHRWVPNTANSEMKKEGCFSYSHFCINGVSQNQGAFSNHNDEIPATPEQIAAEKEFFAETGLKIGDKVTTVIPPFFSVSTEEVKGKTFQVLHPAESRYNNLQGVIVDTFISEIFGEEEFVVKFDKPIIITHWKTGAGLQRVTHLAFPADNLRRSDK